MMELIDDDVIELVCGHLLQAVRKELNGRYVDTIKLPQRNRRLQAGHAPGTKFGFELRLGHFQDLVGVRHIENSIRVDLLGILRGNSCFSATGWKNYEAGLLTEGVSL